MRRLGNGVLKGIPQYCHGGGEIEVDKDNGGASDQIVYTFTEPVNFTAGVAGHLFVAVNPGHASATVEVAAELSDGTSLTLGQSTLSADGIAAGKVTKIAVSYVAPIRPGLDLSAEASANTYIVNRAATAYKFKATVMGNGQARTYSWSEDGTEIVKSYSEADIAIAPEEAKLVWYNSPVTEGSSPVEIESVVFEDGYIYFDTPAQFVEGNALIAAYDASGTILWSWNIWAVENYDCNASAKKAGRYTIMDRNLGALAGNEAMTDPSKTALAMGNYYQWGRKDPLPAAASYDDLCWGIPTHTPIAALQKSGSSESGGATASDLIFTTDVAANAYSLADNIGASFTVEQAVEASVKYPYRWIASGSNSDNTSTSWYKWFDASATSFTNRPVWRHLWGSTNYYENPKSIYDPCPAGWKVPTADAFATVFGEQSAAASNGKGSYNSLYGLYFPNGGQRRAGFGGGQLCDMTTMTYTTATTNNVFPVVSRHGGAITPWNAYAGAAYQLRCVKESVDDLSTVTAQPSGAKVVLMGDSITEQWATPWDDNRGRVEYFTENGFVGKGVSGNTSANMIARYCTAVLALDPKCVVISAGTNDVVNLDNCFRSVEDIFNNICLMANLARAQGAKVIIASGFPTWWNFTGFTPSRDYANRVIELNKLLKPYAEAMGYPYADYHTALKDDVDNLKIEYSHADNDRVHPNRAGYLVMEPILLEAVRKAFYDPDAIDSGGQIDDIDKWQW